MNVLNPDTSQYGKRWLGRVYILTLTLMAITGFGQMPIFKRYYIADIPGMAWTGDFFMTHTLHYLGAMVLLALFSYFIVDFLLIGKKRFRLTNASFIRVVLLAGLVGTGIFRVFKNLPNVVFSPGFTFFIDIIHLGLAMVFLLAGLVFLIGKMRWVVQRI
jgi:hypothetical protein